MKAYLDIVEKVLTQGRYKKPVRIEQGKQVELANDTLCCPNVIFSHEMSEGFPLLTTKKMAVRSILVELEGFIKGITDKKWYQERKCKIWDEWANPVEAKKRFNYVNVDLESHGHEYTIKDAQKEVNDLGPIYGYQWRNFGKHYGPDNLDGLPPTMASPESDQLKSIVDKLHTNPYDRRMVCSAWNPNHMHMMALPPCHTTWGVSCVEDTINLGLLCRSIDVGLGLPFNVASYATLLLLLAKESNLRPGNLSIMILDSHIYRNHISKLNEQLNRQPMKLPTLEILNKQDGSFSIFDWTYEDVKLHNYSSHPKLDIGSVTV